MSGNKKRSFPNKNKGKNKNTKKRTPPTKTSSGGRKRRVRIPHGMKKKLRPSLQKVIPHYSYREYDRPTYVEEPVTEEQCILFKEAVESHYGEDFFFIMEEVFSLHRGMAEIWNVAHIFSTVFREEIDVSEYQKCENGIPLSTITEAMDCLVKNLKTKKYKPILWRIDTL